MTYLQPSANKTNNMKHLILAAIIVTATQLTYGQCEKKAVFTASKTEYLGADSSVQRTDDETTVIEFDKAAINITPGQQPTMTGKVNSTTCNWTTPYKAGRTRMKVALTNQDGGTTDVTITIEGKDGKITFLAEIDNAPDKKIRLVADKFEEKR